MDNASTRPATGTLTSGARATATLAPGPLGAGVIALLVLAVFLNYVDRGNLATAAPLMKDELHLSSTQIGLILSAFFWSYAPGQLVAGWLAERINAYRTLAIGLAIWSIATALTGLATGFVMLIGLRLLLGVGESASFPCTSKLLAQHLPPHRLGGANGLIGIGLSLGPAFGTFAGGLLMARLGWRAVFVVLGAGTLLWLVPWFLATRRASALADTPSLQTAPSFRSVLTHRELWGASLGHFSANYAFYFVVSWLPLYLVKARGFSVSQMAEIGGLIYVVYAASAVTSGWLTDRWIRAGASVNRARKTAAIACHLVAAVSLMGVALGDQTVSMVSLFVAAAGFGLNTAGIFAIGQTLAGPRAAGKWVSVQNGFGNLAGIVAPIVTGVVVDQTGAFYWAFIVAGCVSLAGVLGWGVIVRKVAPVCWAPQPGAAAA